MKKILLSIVVVAALATSGFAQSKFGVRTGVNFASTSLASKDDLKSSNLTGAHLGLLYEAKIASIISIQPELLLSQAGSVTEATFAGVTNKTTTSVNYLTVPILLKANIELSKGLSFVVSAGPYGAYSLGGKQKTEEGGVTTDKDVIAVSSYDADKSDKIQVSSLDFGVLAGVGFSYDILKTVSVFADLRYGLGLNQVSKVSDASKDAATGAIKDQLEAKNRNLQFSVGAAIIF